MRQGLVDVKELDTFRCVIVMDRLQTGDVTQKGWSRETTKHQHRVFPLQLGGVPGLPIGIKAFQQRKSLPNSGCGLIELTDHASTGTVILVCRLRMKRKLQGYHQAGQQNGSGNGLSMFHED